jgi:hypothetical protein
MAELVLHGLRLRHYRNVETFAMYADWRLDEDADDDAVTAGTNSIDIGDPEACVWRDEADARIVRFSFDVNASDFDEAGQRVKQCLAQLSAAGLPGKIIHMEGSTETHLSKWELEDL